MSHREPVGELSGGACELLQTRSQVQPGGGGGRTIAFEHQELRVRQRRDGLGECVTAVQLQDAGLLISFVFYGLDEVLSGLMIFRSRFLHRVLGILLSLAGLCYFTDGFLSFLAPALINRLYPYILYPCFPGEFSIALWMAVVGLNVSKWRAWNSTATLHADGL